MLILGALAAVAIPRISQSAQNARVQRDQANLQIINQALERYYAENGVYPSNMGTAFNAILPSFPDGVPIPETGFFMYDMTKKRFYIQPAP